MQISSVKIVNSIYLITLTLVFSAKEQATAQFAPISPAAVENVLQHIGVQINKRNCDEALGHPPEGMMVYPAFQFGEAELLSGLANYILMQAPGGKSEQLRAMLAHPASDQELFLQKLSDWLEQTSSFKSGTVQQVRKNLLQLQKQNRLTAGRAHAIEPSGFMAYEDYFTVLLDGDFPLVDPHDVYLHLPSFLNPKFAPVLHKRGALLLQAGARIQFEHLTNRSGSLEANRNVYKYLTAQVRDYSNENWTYLTRSADGRPHLFIQGAVPLQRILGFVEERPGDEGLTRIFQFADQRTESRYAIYETWEGWTQFQESLEGRPLVAELRSWQNKVEFSLESEKRKLLLDAEEALKQDFPTQDLRTKNIAAILDRMAEVADADPDLRAAMSFETRVKVSTLLLTLCETYLRWADQNL